MQTPDHIPDFYAFEDIPTGRDLHLVKESDLDFLMKTWAAYVSNDADKEHPNNFLEFRMAAIEDVLENFAVVNVCVDQTMRYHSVLIVLPKDSFVKCVKWWNCEKRAYLIVSDEWFKSLSESRYSSFAMVDAIGVKKNLAEHGTLDRMKYERFRKRLDSLSRRYRRYVFLSFADSVLIKCSFKGSLSYFVAYNPEEMVELVQRVRELFITELGFDSYAIMSQGTTSDYGPKPYQKAFLGNHFSIASLGTPFAHLFEIDAVARKNIEQGVHKASSLYVTTKCFNTFYLNSSYKDSIQEIQFESKVGHPEDSIYNPVNIDEVIRNFRDKSKRDLFWRLQFNYFWSWRTYFKRRLREIKLNHS